MFFMIAILSSASQGAECIRIEDQPEKVENYIGSAFVERTNVGESYTPPRYWKSDLGLAVDLEKKIGLGNGPAPLNNTRFHSDEYHQWYLCEKKNGYFYAILEPIMGFGD